MIALGIETATTVCGVALLLEGTALIERVLDIPNIHSEQLVPLIEEVMKQADVRVNQFDVIAVSIGPGSFTGLRIGLSVAKGLSFAADIPLIPVPTLQALAYNISRGGRALSGASVLSLLDARRGEAYCAVYRMTRDLWPEEIKQAVIASYEGITRWAKDHLDVMLVGDAQNMALEQEELKRRWYAEYSRCSPASIVTLGVQRYNAGERADRSSLEPKYLREFIPRESSGV